MPLDDTMTRAVGIVRTLDTEARTVRATLLSGPAPHVRPAPAPDGSRTRWVETLDAAGADMSRFEGAPVLLDHRNSVNAAVGSVASFTVEGGRIEAEIRFDASPEAETLMRKIESGSVRGTSLGYRVAKYARDGMKDGLPVFKAVEWTPFEASVTPVPVDSGAQFRNEDIAMTEQTATDAPADTTAHDEPGTMSRADQNRMVRSIATTAGLGHEWADDLIDREVSVDEARRLAFDAMSRRSAPVDNRPARIEQGASYDDPAVLKRAMSDALAASFTPLVKVDGTPAERFRSYRASDFMAELASMSGDRVNRHDREALLKRSVHTTSDFPGILEDAANKSLLAMYQAATPAYRKIAARKSFADFKAHRFLRAGDFPAFTEITAEGGEPTYGTISEQKETVTAKEFATGIAISRRALVNDDLSALADFSAMIAQRAAAHEDNLVFTLIASDGPTMSDTNPLWHTSHGNKAATGSAIDVTNVGKAVAAMRKQTGLDGIPLAVEPKYLVVGPDYELSARQLVTAITPSKASDTNPWSSLLEVVVDPNISGNRWYLFAEPAAVPVVVFGFVAGAEGPQISTETDFDTRSIRVRAGLDFACGAIDWRGAYMNAGA